MGNTTLIDDKNIRILRRLSGLCGVSVPFTLNAVLVAGYFRLDNYLSFGQVVYFGLTGCVVYVFLTIIAYLDCRERDLTAVEQDFCEGVLLNCNYQFSGTPSYYERVHRKLLEKRVIRDDHLVGRHLGNILYHIVIFQVLGFIGLLALSALSAGLSLLFVRLIEVPGIIIDMAVMIVMPFPFVAYAFCSRMLYEFTQHSLDADELKYYFSASRLLFGALKYYDETRASSSRGDLNFYKKMINAPIRLS